MAEEKKPKAGKAGDGADAKKGADKKATKAKAAQKGGVADGEARSGSAQKAELPTGPYTPRMKKHYDEVVCAELTKQFGYKNALEVPTIEKIVLNMGVGEAVNDAKKVTAAAADLALIAGQKPVVTRARNAISTFKLRENMPIGVMVTLRGERMYEFFDRFVSAALPRVRDFKGVPDRAFDGRGNYSLGLSEQVIFPEINLDKVDKIKGLTVTICTSARSDAEGKALLRALGMPFRA